MKRKVLADLTPKTLFDLAYENYALVLLLGKSLRIFSHNQVDHLPQLLRTQFFQPVQHSSVILTHLTPLLLVYLAIQLLYSSCAHPHLLVPKRVASLNWFWMQADLLTLEAAMGILVK